MPTPTGAPPPQFQEHFDRAARHLRAALTELLVSAAADALAPQEVARRFGLNKTLAWKICKIVISQDVLEIVPHLPGSGGFEIALAAFTKHGAGEHEADSVRAAVEEFESMARLHAGDRGELELMLASMHPDRVDPERSERSRQLAFQGTSSVLGVQARTRFSLNVLARNHDDPDRVDFATLGGVIGFRRLRPTGSWPLLSVTTYGMSEPNLVPMDTDVEPGEAPLLRSFCSQPLPPIHSVPRGERTLFELGEGPVGRTAALSCVFGWTSLGQAPLHGDPEEEEPVGELFFKLDAPCQLFQFDLLLHRDLPIPDAPRPYLYNLIPGEITYPLSQQPRYLLPCPAPVHGLGQEPPVVTTPHIPDYRKMVELACERMERPLEEFRGYRLLISYPPIPSIAVLAHRLPQREQTPSA